MTSILYKLASNRVMVTGGLVVGTNTGGSLVDPIDGYYAAGNFFSDPFAGYRSVIASQTFSGTNGTTTSVPWNNSTITAPTYNDPQLATNAACVIGAPVRVCFLAGDIWNVPAQTYYAYNAGGIDDAHRIVWQGDPAASRANMPTFDFNGSVNGLNSGYIGPNFNGRTNARWLTWRKIRCQNSQVGFIGLGQPSHDMNGIVVEFCDFLNMFIVPGDNIGCLGVGANNWLNGPSMRYNNAANIYATNQANGKAGQQNAGMYMQEGTTAPAVGYFLHHNFVTNSCTGIAYVKRPNNGGSATVSVGGRTCYNIVTSSNALIYFAGVDTGTVPYAGDSADHNVGWDLNTAFAICCSLTTQSFNYTAFNNTIAEDSPAFLIKGCQGITLFNNLMLGNKGVGLTPSLTMQTQNSGAATCLVTLMDYNGYGTTPQFNTNKFGTPTFTYNSLLAWQSAFTNNAPAQLTANPDTHSQGLLTTAVVNNAAARDYSPTVASGLLTAGQGGKPIGAYNANSIGASDLIGPGWS